MLGNSIALLAIAAFFGVEAYKHRSDRVTPYVLGAFTIAVFLGALFLPALTATYPKVGAFITGAFDDPSSWLVIGIGLFFVLRPFWSRQTAVQRDQVSVPTTDAPAASMPLLTLDDVEAAFDARLTGLQQSLSNLSGIFNDRDEKAEKSQIFYSNFLSKLDDRIEASESDLKTGKAETDNHHGRLTALQVMIRQVVDDYQRMSGVEARLDEKLKTTNSNVVKIEAGIILQADYVKTQIISLFDALGAIYHREQLSSWERTLEGAATELLLPVDQGITFDHDARASWEAKDNAWRRGLQRWVDLGRSYVPDLHTQVFTVPDDHYKRAMNVKLEQFPTPEALFIYKAFCAVLANWRGCRDEVNQLVRQAAFNSQPV